MKTSKVWVEENQYGDVLFPTDAYYSTNPINEDLNYQTPAVKVWYFTNVETLEAWVDSNGLPMPVEYNDTPTYSRKEGIYIIKRYHFKRSMMKYISPLIKTLSKRDLHFDSDQQESLIMYLANVNKNALSGNDAVIRLVHFIPIEAVLKIPVISQGDIRVSRCIDDLYNHAHLEPTMRTDAINVPRLDDNSLQLTVTFNSNKNKKIDLAIGEELVAMNSRLIPGINTDMVTITGTQNKEVVLQKSICPEEFEVCGFFRDPKNNNITDVISKHATYMSASLDHYTNRIKAMREWQKYLIEHEISLQKMYAYIIKNESSITALEKEEMSTVKEGIKFLKDLLF